MFRAYYGLYIKYPIGLSGKTITRQPACSLNTYCICIDGNERKIIYLIFLLYEVYRSPSKVWYFEVTVIVEITLGGLFLGR